MFENQQNNDAEAGDVRERQFEIAREGSGPQTLRTGFLSTCFAVYGWNKADGVAFLWHLDLHPVGFRRIVKRLRAATKGDLSGCEMYLTSGYGLVARALAALVGMSLALKIALSAPDYANKIYALLAFALVFYFVFGNWVFARFYVSRYFGKSIKFVPAVRQAKRGAGMRLPRDRRVEVAVDVKAGPSLPIIENGDRAVSKRRFGFAKGTRSWWRPLRVTAVRKKGGLLEIKRRKTLDWGTIGAWAIVGAVIVRLTGPLILKLSGLPSPW